MASSFPLPTAPNCLNCHQPCTRKIISAGNKNGNAGRPYYMCVKPSHGFKFACWDDDRGIASDNPQCECGLISRKFTADGNEFFGCPVGTCSWVTLACCFWAEDDEENEVERRPPVEARIADDLPWEIHATSEESPLCSICRIALEKLRGPNDFVTTSISVQERSEAGCHLCALFVRYAERHPKATQGPEPPHYLRYEHDPIDLGQATIYLLSYELGKPFVSHKWHTKTALGCLPSTSTTADSQRQSPTGSFEQSMAVASQWIQQCEHSHLMCQLQDASRFLPTRLIDVGPKKIFREMITPILVEGRTLPPDSKYLTLSHCWGPKGTMPLKLLTSNVSSMVAAIPFTQLPKTFQDAIVVTQQLGLRYIWIDSLCIIQDDGPDWQRESALMAEVYQNATCNITAAQAPNSSVGLFLDHDPKFTKPVKAGFKTDDQGEILHDFWPEYLWSHGLGDGPLMSRGWVLQECLLSRRNLHFKRDQVAWECRGGAFCETFPGKLPFFEDPRPLKHQFSMALFSLRKDAVSIRGAWNSAVAGYTACKLTYSTDKLVAFGGIATTFSEQLGNRYLAGLWLENISYQLLWCGRKSTHLNYVAPSWSWASTDGDVRDTFLPMHPGTDVRQLEVLEAHVDLISQNLYGQVKAGYLRVAGRLAIAKVSYHGPEPSQGRPTLFLPDTEGKYSSLSQSLNMSWNDNDIKEAQKGPSKGEFVYILAVLDHVKADSAHRRAMAGGIELDVRRAPSTRWLILTLVENQPSTFQRIGSFAADNGQYSRYEDACRWFDQDPGKVPVHSTDGGIRYAVTLV
ncbi:hypothetical protein G7046_g2646 [Stylonectria norvegica]|nr:hypothetical protein G7046_g2646 [Stylonectria norvegica]